MAGHFDANALKDPDDPPLLPSLARRLRVPFQEPLLLKVYVDLYPKELTLRTRVYLGEGGKPGGIN